MNTVKSSVEIELKTGNFGAMAWLSNNPSFASTARIGTDTPLLVERIGVFPSSGDIHRRINDPRPLLAYLKNFYAHQALDVDERDGLKVIFVDWRFRVHIPRGDAAIVINVETRRDPDLMPLKTAELLGHLERFEHRMSCPGQ
ncbi:MULTISPECIES: mannose-1-phosphate guanylyltransferase [unclassified Pseudomonas]|uniref:mannose-1-phosphate guanylyltransferase n=1 Tax=unclassified Pseudomonas TaxID=196821 RepID=UPI0010F58A06|nr:MULTISPECIES: mannose-1-phosphate guanylyltransferase [unclassified Pseudomonas]NUU34841.1 mannose-1-phosphate guanylyltransferase [Pseudomonas sp. C2B4]